MNTPPTPDPAVAEPTSAPSVVTPLPLRLLATDESLACVDDLCLPPDAAPDAAPDANEDER